MKTLVSILGVIGLGILGGAALYKYAPRNYSKKDFTSALAKARKLYSFPGSYFKLVEQIYRLETAHFRSTQYIRTGTPGMERHGKKFPWGWTMFADLWKSFRFRPVGVITMTENYTGVEKQFLVMPSVFAGITALLLYIDKFGAYRWYSTDPVKQAEYKAKLDKITTPIYNTLT